MPDSFGSAISTDGSESIANRTSTRPHATTALALALLLAACDESTTDSHAPVDAGRAGAGGSAGIGAAGAGGSAGVGAARAGGSAGIGAAGAGGSAGVGAARAGGTGAFPCPATAPPPSSACTTEGALCGYDPASTSLHCGTDCAPCRDLFECTNGAWTLQTKPAHCALGPAAACPPSEPQELSLCATAGITCRYSDRLCYCAICADSGSTASDPLRWVCVGPPPAGCPRWMPTHGESCAIDGQLCDGYETCFACGPWPAAHWATCKNGKWSTLEHGDCQP